MTSQSEETTLPCAAIPYSRSFRYFPAAEFQPRYSGASVLSTQRNGVKGGIGVEYTRKRNSQRGLQLTAEVPRPRLTASVRI